MPIDRSRCTEARNFRSTLLLHEHGLVVAEERISDISDLCLVNYKASKVFRCAVCYLSGILSMGREACIVAKAGSKNLTKYAKLCRITHVAYS